MTLSEHFWISSKCKLGAEGAAAPSLGGRWGLFVTMLEEILI